LAIVKSICRIPSLRLDENFPFTPHTLLRFHGQHVGYLPPPPPPPSPPVHLLTPNHHCFLTGFECDFEGFTYTSRVALQLLWFPILSITTVVILLVLFIVFKFTCAYTLNRKWSRFWRNKYRACRRRAEECCLCIGNIAGEDISRPETKSLYQPQLGPKYRNRAIITIFFFMDYAIFPVCMAVFHVRNNFSKKKKIQKI